MRVCALSSVCRDTRSRRALILFLPCVYITMPGAVAALARPHARRSGLAGPSPLSFSLPARARALPPPPPPPPPPPFFSIPFFLYLPTHSTYRARARTRAGTPHAPCVALGRVRASHSAMKKLRPPPFSPANLSSSSPPFFFGDVLLGGGRGGALPRLAPPSRATGCACTSPGGTSSPTQRGNAYVRGGDGARERRERENGERMLKKTDPPSPFFLLGAPMSRGDALSRLALLRRPVCVYTPSCPETVPARCGAAFARPPRHLRFISPQKFNSEHALRPFV